MRARSASSKGGFTVETHRDKLHEWIGDGTQSKGVISRYGVPGENDC